ncbi:MAG: hypothetical protein AAGA96_17570 [Verrucomicrobiota bacterium]
MIRLFLNSLLAQQRGPGEDEIFDIVVITPQPPIWPTVLWSIITLFLFGLVAWALWYFLWTKRPQSTEPPPQLVAAKAFRILRQKIDSLEANEATLEASEVLKNYLSAKYNDPVRYETSHEFLGRISKTNTRLPNAAQQELRGFLVDSDAVKFGNTKDGAAQVAPLLKRAENVIHLCQTIGAPDS